MRAGDSFLILAELPHPHLWVILSDPELDEDEVLYIHVTSWERKSDPACPLGVGDHPFIDHPSCLHYRAARCDSLAYLETRKASGGHQERVAVSAAVLGRMREGARVSRFLPRRFKRLLAHQGLIVWNEEDEGNP